MNNYNDNSKCLRVKFVTSKRPPEIEDIRRRVAKQTDINIRNGTFGQVPEKLPDLLTVKTGQEWMRQDYGTPRAKMIFGDFWFEDELCILFADTNLGKSILAVQIGNSLTNQGSVGPFGNQMPTGTPVLYIDFEMSSRQFEKRYHDSRNIGTWFGPSFYRAEFNPKGWNPHSAAYDKLEDYLRSCIVEAVLNTEAKVLIIDNLTYMGQGITREAGAVALMKMLKAMQVKYKLSILALAHTPKRDPRKPLTVNDLQGSKMLINFCDSAFAIGESYAVAGGRYLKQIKQRNTGQVYGENNVCLCTIGKELNDLVFKFDGYGHQRDHLKGSHAEREALRRKALDLQTEGMTYRDISVKLGIGLGSVGRLLG